MIRGEIRSEMLPTRSRAIAVWISSLVVAYAVVPPAFGGACCLPDGSCQDVPIAGICNAIGGEFLGAATTCATSACDGACCMPDGSCALVLPADCTAAGGVFNGRGTICADVGCGVGGCCLPDRVCALLSLAGCVDQGGLVLGEGTVCDRVICGTDDFDFPLSPGSEVLTLPKFNALSGTLRLVSVTAGVNGSIGALATIENLSGSVSSGITIRFEATLDVTGIPGIPLSAIIDEVRPVPLLAPTDGVPGSGGDFNDLGFISAEGRDSGMLANPPDDLSFFVGLTTFPVTVEASGQLIASSSSAIAFAVDDFRAFGTVLIAYRYIPLGACCLDDFSCSIQSEADCLGNPSSVFWSEGMACADVACGPGEGACCFIDNSCDILTDVDCAAAGGVFQGPGTICVGIVCRGACCLGTGTCLFLSELKCIEFGGTYYGDGTQCTPNTCPTSIGACCFPNDTCQLLSSSACSAAGGLHGGAGTGCSAASCGVACAADVTGPFGLVPDGNVDALDLLMVLAEWGRSCTSGCHGDVAGPVGVPDGQVDAIDFLVLLSEWGSPAVCGP